MPDIQTYLFQLLRHPWPATAAQAEAQLFLDMRQCHQSTALSAAGRTAAEGPQTARTNIHDITQPVGGKAVAVFLPFRDIATQCPAGQWMNLNLMAFGPRRTALPSSGKQSPGLFSGPLQFKISLSSLKMRFSRRSRSFSWTRLKSSCDTTSVSRGAVIHLLSVDRPTPGSSANCLRLSPLVSAIRNRISSEFVRPVRAHTSSPLVQ
ncbi:hypothetical protein PhaeoP97_02543 [Phaeobacter porticola]|uniref:Uncharacterized protein n=1 Tax=Phaeobacter porticola TaxID=1844006 RepID=A0A1L3I761_9RHOB|nr:hypothetical protein PhaeoP97_02543 [Phaeobacter porticola]